MAFQPTGSCVLTEPFNTPDGVDPHLVFQQNNLQMDILEPGHHLGGTAHASDQSTHGMLEDGIEEIPSLRKPTRSDWRDIEPVIANLYRNHTLEEIKYRLAEEYRLHVTTKMLKDKRRNWKLDKNIKPQEMRAIIRKKFERERIGKASVFQVRGKKVAHEKISRYVKATRRSVLNEILATAPTPPELICYTPLASPMTTPRMLETPELIAKLVQDYINGSLDAGTWMHDEDSQWYSVKNSPSSIGEFYDECDTAISRPVLEYDSNTWSLLQSALARIEDIVASENPFVLPYLFHVIRKVYQLNRPSYLAFLLLKQFSAMSDAKLPVAHPFNQIFARCLNVQASDLSQICSVAMSSQVDGCSKRLGRFNVMTLDIQKSTLLLQIIGLQTIETISNLLREIESELGISDIRALDMRLSLAFHYNNLACFHKAIETVQTLLGAIPQWPRNLRDGYLFEGLYQLAMAQKGLLETEMAEQNIRQAIYAGACVFGWENGRVLQMMLRLEEWLGDWGREVHAKIVRMDIDGMIESKQKKLAQEEEQRWRRCKAANPSLATPPLSQRQLDVTM